MKRKNARAKQTTEAKLKKIFAKDLDIKLTAKEEENAELRKLLGQAVQLGKEQADEYDRFWAAMGVNTADITVDMAIEKYKKLENDYDVEVKENMALKIQRDSAETRMAGLYDKINKAVDIMRKNLAFWNWRKYKKEMQKYIADNEIESVPFDIH